MPRLKLAIVLKMPHSVHPLRRAKSELEEVKEAVDMIESGCEHVDEEWELLKKIHSELSKQEDLSKDQEQALNLIESISDKHSK